MRQQHGQRRKQINPGWWTALLVLFLVGVVGATYMFFTGSYKTFVAVTVTAPRAGLVMDRGAKVKYRGVQVGRVGPISTEQTGTRLVLELEPEQVSRIPANVAVEIRSTTIFGAKYVDLVDPETAVSQRLSAGAVLASRNVTTEVNTVFESLTNVLHAVDPAKLNATLEAVASALRNRGPQLGRTLADSESVLRELNPRTPVVQNDFRALNAASGAYSDAAADILAILDNAAVTSRTISSRSAVLDSMLVSVAGLGQTGADFTTTNHDNLVQAINLLEPTSRLLYTYSPSFTCMLQGAQWALDMGGNSTAGGATGKSIIVDSGLLFGDNVYKYPQNLPKNGARGGPDGRPGCGSLPDVTQNYPPKALVTDTGWGTGPGDLPTQPGIGSPSFVDYLFGAMGNQR
ncbi:MCE family protein [Nocardia sp. NPDC050630]|uniref:MCE family protein n=1 Tax=Nocardia sp. NPDC050630 TaxID=3364321 RepID=UPI0037B24253